MPISAQAFTTASAPMDGVYRFTFGVDATQDGSYPVPASAVYDAQGAYDASATFSYGFLGTTETSYADDVPASPSCAEPRAIDGFSVVQGQCIVLHDTNDANNVSCVCGPAAAEYLPLGASPYEGRYPIRFAMRGEERAYYAVTCTVANASSTTNADVTIFSERTHIIAHHLELGPGETRTFAWSVELAPNVYKTQGTYYDNAVNVVVVGENAALASLTVVKQPQTAGTVRGESVENMNVGRTMWLCTDSTGTDQAIATPFFSLQNYAGVGSGLSRWAPANLSIRNQGEGGLATSAGTHRQSCLLKPGDYLYVEYGHNESGITSYTNNLETYLADANAAGADLIIVSPVERRTSWNSSTSTWGRSLQGIAEAGEAWVEDKIAKGARNVAFIDLNKKYNDWMNAELRRINGVNGDVSLNAAISFYYRSAKGANVDNTHINTAGADQAAYWVWQDALERVAAGENAAEGSAAKVQSDVLKGITEGCQLKVDVGGTVDNKPWLVTDDIINAGAAPNAFWDTPVSEGFAYVNDAVVADVQAVANSDGTVTISNVTMRILNPNNYYKCVIDVVSADGAATNRYWSYYNYDIGGAGKVSGDLVDPNQPGFLTSDKDKATVAAADVETIAVPAGGKALVWIAEADAGTWQVGGNGPCSAKYPVEWWNDVIFDNDCDSLDGWAVNSQAVNEYSLSDKGGIYFMSAGADSGNNKKNYGFYHQFDDGAQMANGRYRVSFKVMMDSGHITWQLFNSLGTTTTPFNGTGTTFLDVKGTTLTAYAGTAPHPTMNDDGEAQNIVNKLRWIDVDVILDRDNDRAWVSAGGSEYVEYQNMAFLPGGYAGTTWKYFGISCESQMSSYGYVDDIKIVRLASVEYPTIAAEGSSSSAVMGSVAINGYATNSLAVYAGSDLLFNSVNANPDYYTFVCWRDGNGADVASNSTLLVEGATEDVSRTAVFRAYAPGENRVTAWDFSGYQKAFALTATGLVTNKYDGLEIVLNAGDTITREGIGWGNVALSKSGGTAGETSRHIEWRAPEDGSVSVVFQIGSIDTGKSVYPYLMVATNDQAMASWGAYASLQARIVDEEYTLTFEVEAGNLYKIYSYFYNRSSTVAIKSITYTRGPADFDADIHQFVWNPDVSEGAWNNPANWLYEGSVPASTYPGDASQDVVTFASAATVSFTEAAYASNVVLNADVTMRGNTLSAVNVVGTGSATLENAGFANVSGTPLTNTVNVVMTAGTTNWFNTVGAANNAPGIHIRGNISGEGCYRVNLANVRMCNACFYGNNNDFRGDVHTSGGTANRSVIQWDNENAVGTNTYLHIGHSYGNYNSDSYRMGGSVKLGGVDGSWWDRYDGNTLTIGHLNRDSSISIYNGVDGRANSVVKEGTANLTLGTTWIKNLTINGGTVTMPIGTAPSTLTMAEETKIVLVGNAAWTVGATTNLFSYTTLAGVSADALTNMVEVTGLASALVANISVANGIVTATIAEKPVPSGKTVSVFLTGGQSNTDGRVPNSDLPTYLANNEYALVSSHGTVSESTELGTFSAWAPTGKWAYDTEVYYRLAQALNEEFYVVKTSYGGTSVHPGVNNSPSGHENAWLPGYGSGYHWSADEDFLAATVSAGRTFVKDDVTYDGQSMLKAWIENIDAAIDAIVATGNTPDVKAIIWHQGESDNNNGNYASNLTAVVTYVRQHLATKLGDDKYLALPFFCGNIPRRSSLFKAGLDRQFKAIEATADNNMHVVDIYDLTMLSDAKHFDAASAITFGKRLFNRMIDEGVIEGEKVEVEDCVRVPDFGVEHVVNNTTTWTFSGMTETIGVLTNVAGLYFRPENSGSRGFKSMGLSKSLSFSIGDTTPIDVTRGFYTCGRGYGSRITESSSAGGNESGLVTMLAMNAGRAGRFEIFGLSNASDVKMRVYFNGTLVDSGEAVGDKGTLLGVSARNAGKGTYYIDLSGYIYVLAARFVPDEEMPSVTLSISADGWTTFGNLYESNFELPHGVKAYAVSPVDGNPTLLAMSEVGAVNIGGAVVVNGPAGSYTLEPGVGAAFGGENLMVVQKETGVVAPTSGSDFFNFEFKVQDGKPVFVRAQGDATLDAGKAFFSITEGDEHAQQSTLRFHEAGGSDESGVLVRADSAESAAAMVNPPTRPSEAASAVTEEAYAAYFTNAAVAKADAEGVFVVTVLLDRNVVGLDDTLATVSSVELSDADSATLTLSNAKPGLYYSLVGGAYVENIATEGQRTLAMSGTVSPSKPEIESDSPARFYRVKVSSTSGL